MFSDLDALDQKANEIAPPRPIDLIQSITDRLRESLELADDHRQSCPEISLLGGPETEMRPAARRPGAFG